MLQTVAQRRFPTLCEMMASISSARRFLSLLTLVFLVRRGSNQFSGRGLRFTRQPSVTQNGLCFISSNFLSVGLGIADFEYIGGRLAHSLNKVEQLFMVRVYDPVYLFLHLSRRLFKLPIKHARNDLADVLACFLFDCTQVLS